MYPNERAHLELDGVRCATGEDWRPHRRPPNPAPQASIPGATLLPILRHSNRRGHPRVGDEEETDKMSSSAHALSLPLFTALQQAEDMPVAEASEEIEKTIARLRLHEDLHPVIVIQGEPALEIEADTETGSQVLKELSARSSFPPCPENSCESGSDGACKWCGKIDTESGRGSNEN